MNPEQEQVIQSLHTEIDRILHLSIYQMRKLELIALFKNLQLRAERAEQEMKLLADIRDQDLFLYLTLKKEQDDLQSKLSVAKEECAAANKGARINAIINQSLTDKLSIAEQKIEEMMEALELVLSQNEKGYLSFLGMNRTKEVVQKAISSTPSTDWVRRSEVEKLAELLSLVHNHSHLCAHQAHWDATMQHGAGCPICIDQQKAVSALTEALTLTQSFLKNQI